MVSLEGRNRKTENIMVNTENTLKRLTPEATINQIVSADRSAAKLLSSIGMNPEQFQDQTLRSACRQLQWNEEELLSWIKKHGDVTECIAIEPEKAKKDDVVTLSDQMLSFMQPCIHDRLTDIARTMPRVQLVHGNQYTWLKDIEWHFNTMKENVERYLLLEKETLFPLAKELKKQEESILYGKAKNLKRAMDVLEDDRKIITKKMALIRNYSNGFQHPAGACSTFRMMNKNMADLGGQLTKYFEVEKKKLFPIIKKQLQSV